MSTAPRPAMTDRRTPPPGVVKSSAAGAALVLVAMQLILGSPPQSAPENVATPSLKLRINPNTATRAELMLLPRIGPALADYIIEYRESCAPQRAFKRAEDLDRVHRIGPATVELLRPHLRFDAPGSNAGREDGKQ